MWFLEGGEKTIAGARVPVPVTADEAHMLRAIELAERGRGRTGPNPLVGAVVVTAGEVMGEGFHEVVGGPHAEVNALEDAGDGAGGSTMYVTLEPCSHFGRTPPCTEAIIAAGVSMVVMATRDPNPDVAGGGRDVLEAKGVETSQGPYSELARRQNEAYLKWVTTGLPFVTLKMALTFDGKTATRVGDSRWVTSDESRRDVHLMRSWSDAVAVGIGTVLADDPRLTVRMVEVGAKPPLRVVVDGEAATPPSSRVADTTDAPTLVAVSATAHAERVKALEGRGVEVARMGEAGRVDLRALLEALGSRGVASLMVEGGAELAYSFLEEYLIDRFIFYFAPKIVGGGEAPGAVGGEGLARIRDAWKLEFDSVAESGGDIKVIAYPGSGGRGCSRE